MFEDEDYAVRVKDESRRGTPNVEASHELQMRLGIDLDVRGARNHGCHFVEDAPSGPAGLTEGGRELDQGGPLAELAARIRSIGKPGVGDRFHERSGVT